MTIADIMTGTITAATASMSQTRTPNAGVGALAADIEVSKALAKKG